MDRAEEAREGVARGPVEEAPLVDVALAAASPLRRFYLTSERAILGVASVAAVLLAWEWVAARELVPLVFISSPMRIAKAAVELAASGDLWNDLRVSGIEFIVGYAMSVAVGIPLGIATGWYRRLFYLLDPFISGLYATPRVALLPLIIIWVGIGIWSKIVVVFLGAVFPILINTLAAVRTTDERLLRAARSFGADDLQVFRTIVLPSSVPFILTGLRLGVGRALVGVVVGELYAATAGIGFLITVAGASFQTDKVFVGILIIAAAGMVSMEVLSRLERRFEKWRPRVGAAP
ncbi:MAG TPA: ABC transporter permease [Candidatus Methylomirabilis sp.]|jgi:NitT/TauT family transport system permease protein|nr:ABC transporter permease [Candidatus Methylomirabilis sp.]